MSTDRVIRAGSIAAVRLLGEVYHRPVTETASGATVTIGACTYVAERAS